MHLYSLAFLSILSHYTTNKEVDKLFFCWYLQTWPTITDIPCLPPDSLTPEGSTLADDLISYPWIFSTDTKKIIKTSQICTHTVYLPMLVVIGVPIASCCYQILIVADVTLDVCTCRIIMNIKIMLYWVHISSSSINKINVLI